MFEKSHCIQFIWGNFSLFLRTEQLYLRNVVGFPHMSCMSCSLQALSYLLWIKVKTLIWPLKNMNTLQSQLHALTFSFRIHWYDSEVIVPLKWWVALVWMQQNKSKFWYCSPASMFHNCINVLRMEFRIFLSPQIINYFGLHLYTVWLTMDWLSPNSLQMVLKPSKAQWASTELYSRCLLCSCHDTQLKHVMIRLW